MRPDPGGAWPVPAWVDGILVPRDKQEVHRLGLRHKAVSVFLVDGDLVLIQRRALTKYHTPGLWANSCCTHPHWQEDPAACAQRRVAQELGLAIAPPEHLGQVEYRADVGGGMVEHELVDIFRATVPRGTPLKPDPAEVIETRWVGARGLVAEVGRDPGRYTPWLRIYLSDHFRLVFGPSAERR